MCAAAKHWCTDRRFRYKQKDMPKYRKMIAHELVNRELEKCSGLLILSVRVRPYLISTLIKVNIETPEELSSPDI